MSFSGALGEYNVVLLRLCIILICVKILCLFIVGILSSHIFSLTSAEDVQYDQYGRAYVSFFGIYFKEFFSDGCRLWLKATVGIHRTAHIGFFSIYFKEFLSNGRPLWFKATVVIDRAACVSVFSSCFKEFFSDGCRLWLKATVVVHRTKSSCWLWRWWCVTRLRRCVTRYCVTQCAVCSLAAGEFTQLLFVAKSWYQFY